MSGRSDGRKRPYGFFMVIFMLASWAGEGDAPVGLGVAMGMGGDVLRGAWGGCGEMLRGADGVSWLCASALGQLEASKAHGGVVWE